MELKEVYKKIDNLLDIQERRDLTNKEQITLDNLKNLRNELELTNKLS